MATSGSYDYSMTRSDVIAAALRKCGLNTTSNADYSHAATALNIMIKHWVMRGFNLWATKEIALFLEPGTQFYTVGPSGSNAAYTFVEAEVGTAYAAGTTLVLDSTTGMTAADNIGVELDSGTMQWRTIVSVDSSTQVTISSALSSAAAAGNVVYTYTSKPQRPIDIMNARHYIDDRETPVTVSSRKDYYELTNKTTEGVPVHVYYQPTLTNGTVYVWPTASDPADVLKFTAKIQLQDMDAASDDFDFPQEWYRALVWNLAAEIMGEYGIPGEDRMEIQAKADVFLDDCLNHDSESTSVFFSPGY